MRKTYTSPEVKDRWNRNHYDMVSFRTGKGGHAAIKSIAEYKGMSLAAYIRHLIIADAQKAGFDDISAIIGGGGEPPKTD